MCGDAQACSQAQKVRPLLNIKVTPAGRREEQAAVAGRQGQAVVAGSSSRQQ